MLFSHEDYARNPFRASDAIGGLLGTGRLNLFLGSGVSTGFGLPDWALLIARLQGKGDDLDYVKELRGKSDTELMALVDPLDDGGAEYSKAVHEALYRTVKPELANQLPHSPLLLAVAALLTGSCRGRIQRVFTYNYDDLLEQYVQMLGYSPCVRLSSTDFSTWADVEINHVHGFLPQHLKPEDRTAPPVLSEKSYRSRRANIDKGWPAAVAHSLYSKAALFIGLSGDDSATLDVLERAQESVERTADYHGYWLLTPRAYERNHGRVLGVRMCPIPLEQPDFPRFVFAVCKAAARLLDHSRRDDVTLDEVPDPLTVPPSPPGTAESEET